MFLKKCLGIIAVFLVSVQSVTAGNVLTNHLQQLQTDYQKQKTSNPSNKNFKSTDSTLSLVGNDKVILTITVKNKAINTVKNDLKNKGMTEISEYNNLLSGVFPISRLNELNSIKNISYVASHRAMTKSANFVYNAADTAMYSDVVKKSYNTDGTDITIGVLSDSYDCLKGEAKDIENGALPNYVRVLKEYYDCTTGTDEGRAMLQLIHSIAPNATLLFRTASISPVDMASGIVELQKVGANIIVDDISWLTSPFFQDGVIAQAVEEVTKKGTTYFSAAGNMANSSYENNFVGTAQSKLDTVHDFGKASSESDSNFYQEMIIPPKTSIEVVLQWDEPAETGLATNVNATTKNTNQKDLDLFLLNANKNLILTSSQESNIGHDPVEMISYTNTEKTSMTAYLYISNRTPRVNGKVPNPNLIKYIIFGPPPTEELPPVPAQKLDFNSETGFFVLTNLETEKQTKQTSGKGVFVYKPSPDEFSDKYDGFLFDLSSSKFTVSKPEEEKSVRLSPCKEPLLRYKYGDKLLFTPCIDSANVFLIPKGYSYLIDTTGQPMLYLDGTFAVTYDTKSGTIFGHANAKNAIAVGAIPYQNTPWFSRQNAVTENELESFSSWGGTPILFDTKGTRLANSKKERRAKPEIIAPDNVDTTFFPASIPLKQADTDGNNFPNFSGTSAAAPNAAAMGALLLQVKPTLKPTEIKSAMMRGTIPMNMQEMTTPQNQFSTNPCTGIFSWKSGCGLIQADLIFEPNPVIEPSTPSVDNPTITPIAQPQKPLVMLPADLNKDGCIDTSDYGILLGQFRTGTYNEAYDLSVPKDNKITLDDLKKMKTLYTNQPDGTSCGG